MGYMDVVELLGGLGLFLFGMKQMGDGLEKMAGNKMQKIIEMLTSNVFKGVLVGALVTALIQSSSATTVMVVGFVNAGLMSLRQAVGVIMGANIGTTVTAQLISLSGLNSENVLLNIIKPDFLAPLLLLIGVVLLFSTHRKKVATLGEILIGFGMLFVGISMMEGAVSVLKDSDTFKSVFVAFANNPLLGVLAGTLVTAIIQSSSASVGILQAASATGAITFGAAVPIILGQNIGTCITAILAAIGANKNAKRAACIHFMFNLIGTVVFMIVIYSVQYTIGLWFWNDLVNKSTIANFHTVFNVVNTILLMPFTGFLVYLSKKLIPDKKGGEAAAETTYLEERFIATPAVAIAQVYKELVVMSKRAKTNLSMCSQAIVEDAYKMISKIEENENDIDKMEGAINQYLGKIVESPLNQYENSQVGGLFHVVSDLERIGDHTKNLSEIAEQIREDKLKFSNSARKELTTIFRASMNIVDLTISALAGNVEDAYKIEPLEEVIDDLTQKLKQRHVSRVTKKKCDFNTGVLFLEILTNLERVADHCSNIGVLVVQTITKDDQFDPHKYLRELHRDMTHQYRENFETFSHTYEV